MESQQGTRLKRIERFIRTIEKWGNRLPHPVMIFSILCLFILLLSALCGSLGVSVTYTAASSKAGEAAAEITTTARNLLTRDFLRAFMTDFVNIYIRFFPIGLVVVMMISVSVAEQAGLITALMKKLVYGAPQALVTFFVAVVGICANIASDAGIVFAPAIGGAVFYSLGRHPIVGILTGYVAAYGGFSANLLVAGTDVLLAGITQSVVSTFGIASGVAIHPVMNWYVMVASTLMLALVVTVVTEKVIAPVLGEFRPENPALQGNVDGFEITPSETKGLKAAGTATLIFFVILLACILPADSIFRNAEGKLLPGSPLMNSMMFLLFTFFVFVGVFYGRAAGTIRSTADVARYMQSGLVGVAGFLIVCMPASMFIHFFNASNLATILAVKGAQALHTLEIGRIPLVLMLVLLSAGMNLFITSGTSKWMILAPIFVPMLFMFGVHPATAQMAYRIGDSTTNIISPVSAYIPVVLGMMEKYKGKGEELGIGTVISLTLPYSIVLLVCWLVFFALWLVLGLPMGPGAPAFL